MHILYRAIVYKLLYNIIYAIYGTKWFYESENGISVSKFLIFVQMRSAFSYKIYSLKLSVTVVLKPSNITNFLKRFEFLVEILSFLNRLQTNAID